ncbi:MAG: TolC family protein [Helicobacteraceae bacterium]|nr:TolC family protein [Helicobacteraceae bacterium]
MQYIILALISIFFVSCAAPYSNEDIKNEFKITQFENSYINQANKTDSIFEVFGDEDLKTLINLALNNNSDIYIYENRVNIAASQVKIAISKQMPSLNGSASYGFDGDSTINANLMASWELDIFGKYVSSKNSYEELLEQERQNLEYFKVSLISDIALAYFNIKYLQTSIILTRDRIKNYYDLVEIMDIYYRNGLVDFAVFLENKAFLQQEEQTLNSLLKSLEEQKNALRILINDMEYKFADSAYSFSEPIFNVNLENSVEIILNRPDIKAQIAALNATIYQLNSTKAQMYPTLNLSGNLGKILLSPTGIADLAYQILTSLTLPLFSRMEIYENIKISDYTRLQSYYTLQKALYTAISEVNNAIYSININKDLLKINNEMLDENKEILEVLKESNNLGLIDDIEYLNAINSNLLMIKNNIMSYFNTISAVIYLYRSIGGNTNDTKINEIKSIDTQNGEANE